MNPASLFKEWPADYDGDLPARQVAAVMVDAAMFQRLGIADGNAVVRFGKLRRRIAERRPSSGGAKSRAR
ncbi:MAG TPA: hypothetical protein DEP05_08900 [Betaproteobacteria bacterium]|nr:hypothetical protein [Betaproteobacteria bacterium]